MIRRGSRCRSIPMMLPALVCLWLSVSTTAALTVTPALTPTPTCFSPTRPPTPSVSFEIHPETPKVGDVVQVTLDINRGYNGPPSLQSYSASPMFADLHLASSITLEMTAVEAGTGTVSVGFVYEVVDEICDVEPFYIYELWNGGGSVDITVLPRDTPTLTFTPTPTPTCAGFAFVECDSAGEPCRSYFCCICEATRTPTRTPSPCPTGTLPVCPVGSSVACDPNPCHGCHCVTRTPPLTPPQCDVCDGRYCNAGGNTGNCLVQADGGCACVLEVTPSATFTPTPTPTPPASECVGDCSGDSRVTIDEIIRMVNIALSGDNVGLVCPGVDQWCSSGPAGVTINCIIEAVNNALYGCGIEPTPTPAVSLDLRLDRTVGAVHITARLTNTSDSPVFYLSGCSARCRPWMYRPVSFDVTAPDGSAMIVKSREYPYPCSAPVLCPEGPQQISPGESLEEPLEIDGTAWKVDMSDGFEFCGVCTAEPFGAGRFVVTAHSAYSTDSNNVYLPAGHVERTVEFDWP
jgi:hypothetical protein